VQFAYVIVSEKFRGCVVVVSKKRPSGRNNTGRHQQLDLECDDGEESQTKTNPVHKSAPKKSAGL